MDDLREDADLTRPVEETVWRVRQHGDKVRLVIADPAAGAVVMTLGRVAAELMGRALIHSARSE